MPTVTDFVTDLVRDSVTDLVRDSVTNLVCDSETDFAHHQHGKGVNSLG